MQIRPKILVALGGVALLSACSTVDNSGTAVPYGGNPLTYSSSVSSALYYRLANVDFSGNHSGYTSVILPN